MSYIGLYESHLRTNAKYLGIKNPIFYWLYATLSTSRY